jgi:hypothetical protein
VEKPQKAKCRTCLWFKRRRRPPRSAHELLAGLPCAVAAAVAEVDLVDAVCV